VILSILRSENLEVTMPAEKWIVLLRINRDRQQRAKRDNTTTRCALHLMFAFLGA
jgi:hypothetical protein